jgi:PAS domain S-box-containing protein
MLTEHHPVLFVLVLSIALQTAAAIMAIRLIGVTGRRVAWGLIAMALTLMALRRVVPLYRLASGDTSFEPDSLNEVIGLVLSAFMAAGIAGIGPIFAERNLAEKRLRELAQIVESSDDAIVGKTLAGIVTSWNKGAEHLFGYRADDIVGKPINLLVPDDRIAEEWMILDEIRQGHSVNHYETVRRCKDGRLADVSVTVSPIRDEAGRILGASKIARDISERRRADQELRRYREHLEELVAERTAALEAANRELEAFSYSVSHDLRTPLRAIDGFSRMLLTKHADSLGSEAQRLVHVVRENTARMSHLIDDLLAFSRSGRLEMHLERVDMQALVDRVWADLEPIREGRDISLELAPLPPARGDAAMLRQVWTNLLTNAVKFSSKKSTAHIRIDGSTVGTQSVYHVRDDGAGFDQAYAQKLFGVFQRLHGVEEFEGTGIGLAIVKRIVSRHGGEVSAEGEVGAGASFHFTLPAAEP